MCSMRTWIKDRGRTPLQTSLSVHPSRPAQTTHRQARVSNHAHQHLHHNLLNLNNMQCWKGIALQPCYSACSPASVVQKFKVKRAPGNCPSTSASQTVNPRNPWQQWHQTAGSASAEVLITTDACVKALEEDSNVSLSLTLLVNYDLPAKKVCTSCLLL